MRILKRHVLGMVSIAAVLLLLGGCGGGDGEDAPVNRSPSADAGLDQTVEAGDTVTLDGSGSSDADGTVATYQWAQATGPAVSLSNDNQVTTSFAAPGVDTDTMLVFRLTVTDNDGATNSDSVSVTVQPVVPVNQPPTANAGPDQTVDAGSVVMLFGSGSDSDGTVTSVQWSQTAGATVSLSMQDQLLTSFVAPEVDVDTTFMFRLTVTDDDGATASDDASVTVQPVVPTEGPFILGMGRLDDPAFRLQ